MFIISLAIAMVLANSVQGFTRKFVRDRLRYVDLARKAIAPWLAGGAAALVVSPLAVLPLVGVGTALTVGAAVGFGVANGARDIKQGTSPVVYGP